MNWQAAIIPLSGTHLFILLVILAFVFDLLCGDPRWLPHPVVFMGQVIKLLERIFRKMIKNSLGERVFGIFLVIILVAPAFLFSWGIIKFFGSCHILLGSLVVLYFLYTTLALKALQEHIIAVEEPLERGDLKAARQALSLIVGRDTENLPEKGIIKAAAETLAENTSDGVIAPLFYAFLGGAPLAMAYKAVNTLDSMVGYQNEEYYYFGWAAAKFDDLANYIPARLTAFFMLIVALSEQKIFFSEIKIYFQTILREGKKHLSPNSGYPEAAAAVLLKISLGGTSCYGGVSSNRPVIFEEGRAPLLNDLKMLRGLTLKASLLALFLGIIFLALCICLGVQNPLVAF